MKGQDQPLIKFFDGSDKRFIIPLYQRNYDWKEENCKRLFDDLIKLHLSQRSSHFFGSIVSCQKSGSEDISIIDGQQRITTVSLLLVAIVNAIKANELSVKDPVLQTKIYNRYIVDEFQPDERKVRLKPIKNDMEAFDSLIYDSSEQYIKRSNVTRNYRYLYDVIIRSKLTADDIFEAITKLRIINVQLDESDDAQLIFESLNSTGLDLSEADKIRNYLLMSLSVSEQEHLYTNFWNPIEVSTKYSPTPFIRHYLIMKQGKIGRKDEIYFTFKDYVETSGKEKAEIVEDMYHFAQIYKRIQTCDLGSGRLNKKIKQIRTIGWTVADPFFLAFFDYAETNSLCADLIYEVLDVIEGYFARRIICNRPSNALNSVFSTLHKDILRYMSLRAQGDQSTYRDILTYVILNKGGGASHPTDEDVNQNFSTRQIYNINPDSRAFILERMENQDSKESHDVISELEKKNISIEHIMPQTLSAEWKTMLGDDWERIHQQYLHTMANLTLTGYNSQYSNMIFSKKRDLEKGFKDSSYRLNNYLKTIDQWTEEELKTRQRDLLDVFMRLWPMPSSSFAPVTPDYERVALDEPNYDFTGKKLQAYHLHGVRYPSKTWRDMLLKVCSDFAKSYKSTVDWICANRKYQFSDNPSDWNTLVDGTKDVYVWDQNSTEQKIKILQGLFSACNVPASELEFEFRPSAKASDSTIASEDNEDFD